MDPLPLAPPNHNGPLHLAGALDLYQIETARAALLAHLNTHTAAVVDLSRITGCDTAGLQLLIAADRSARAAGRRFNLLAPPSAVRKCAEQLGLLLPGAECADSSPAS